MSINEYQEFKGRRKKKVSLRLVFFIIILLFITTMAYELSKGINKFQASLNTRQTTINKLINLK